MHARSDGGTQPKGKDARERLTVCSNRVVLVLEVDMKTKVAGWKGWTCFFCVKGTATNQVGMGRVTMFACADCFAKMTADAVAKAA